MTKFIVRMICWALGTFVLAILPAWLLFSYFYAQRHPRKTIAEAYLRQRLGRDDSRSKPRCAGGPSRSAASDVGRNFGSTKQHVGLAGGGRTWLINLLRKRSKSSGWRSMPRWRAS